MMRMMTENELKDLQRNSKTLTKEAKKYETLPMMFD